MGFAGGLGKCAKGKGILKTRVTTGWRSLNISQGIVMLLAKSSNVQNFLKKFAWKLDHKKFRNWPFFAKIQFFYKKIEFTNEIFHKIF